MAKQIRFRFTHHWEDLDWVFEKGNEITLPAIEVEATKNRMRMCETMGICKKTADLCQYGFHLVPLSYLEEVKEN